MNTTAFRPGDKIQVLAWTGDVINYGIVTRVSDELFQARQSHMDGTPDAHGSVDTFELKSGTWVLAGNDPNHYPTTVRIAE
jgi:hypothetical protein